jgi:hypothetical protein
MTSGETEPRTEREYAMACQCGACGGTGKCATCVGSGLAQRTELLNPRRIRRNRFDSPDPQPCGVWRFRALLPTERNPGPVTNSEKMAKPDPAPANPVCAVDKIRPCSAECWQPCAQCGKLVCEGHDYLVPVWPPANGGCDRADMLCRECITALWATGDISQDARVQYLC